MKKKIKQNKNIIIAFLAGAFLVGVYVMLAATSSRETMYGTPNNGDAGVVVQQAIERESPEKIKAMGVRYKEQLGTLCDGLKNQERRFSGDIDDKIRICKGMYDEYKPKVCRIHAKALPTMDGIKYTNKVPDNYQKILDTFVDSMRALKKEARIIEDSPKPNMKPYGVDLFFFGGQLYTGTLFNDMTSADMKEKSEEQRAIYSPYWKTYDYRTEKVATTTKEMRDLNTGWIRMYYDIGYTFDCIK